MHLSFVYVSLHQRKHHFSSFPSERTKYVHAVIDFLSLYMSRHRGQNQAATVSFMLKRSRYVLWQSDCL